MPRSQRGTGGRNQTKAPIYWRDQLLPASFRDIPFEVLSVDTRVGRRNQVHQYPFRDLPYIEDMGLDTDEFSIEGYVIQNIENDYDYILERNNLIKALKEKGSGTLVHPFYGSRNVSLVGKASITESFKEGGIARFRMNFIVDSPTDKILTPTSTVSPVNAVDTECESYLDNLIDGFASVFNPANIPGFSALSSLNAVGTLNTMLIAVTNGIQGAGPAKIAQAIKHLSDQYDLISLTTISQACSLGNGIIGMSNGLLSLGGMYGDIVVDQLLGPCSSAVRGFSSGPLSGASGTTTDTGYMISSMSGSNKVTSDFGKSLVESSLEIGRFGESTGNDDPSAYSGTLNDIPITTATRARQSANQTAIVNLARNMSIYISVRSAIRIEYTSYQDMTGILNSIVEKIQDQLLKMGDEAPSSDYATYDISVDDTYSYTALQSLRDIFTKSMIELGANLSTIKEYKVSPVVLPSLVLAYDLYDDLDRESEIIKRNSPLIKHPGFLPGGETIEVLSE